MGFDLCISPPPYPPCLFPPCLLGLLALLTPQEDREPQPWGSAQDKASGGGVLGQPAQLYQGLD